MQAPLDQLFTTSRLLILDFSQIPAGTPPDESMRDYFKECAAAGLNPREPEQRQAFNNRLLAKTNSRYLVSRYGEDRQSMLAGSSIAREGRTIHLGIDIFCREQEIVYSPCDGELVFVGREPTAHSFGYYAVIKPTDGAPFVFLGHLAAGGRRPGAIRAGEAVAKLGDFRHNENGGWSRHLHLQMLQTFDPAKPAPLGYATQADFKRLSERYPDPLPYFPDWRIQGLG